MTEEELVYRLRVAYAEAISDLSKKIDKYLKNFEKMDAEMRALLDSGILSNKDYKSWKFRTIAESKQWEDMRSQLTFDMVHVDQIASDIINDAIPEMYAEGHNYGTYEAEIGSGWDTTYTLYDRDTVARLIKEDEIDLLPVNLDISKDERWNRQHIQSAITQGILQGESIDDIASRLLNVVGMDERMAIRNARTAVTGAQNAGRIDSYIRAEKMGIKMQQMWMATLDGRVRDSHAIMDGEHQEVGKEFSNGCRYPGDPKGAPAEIYNCRCTVVAIVEGADPYNPNLRPSKYLQDAGLTYDEWKRMHKESYYSKHSGNADNHRVSQGKTTSAYSFGTRSYPKVNENAFTQKDKDNAKWFRRGEWNKADNYYDPTAKKVFKTASRSEWNAYYEYTDAQSSRYNRPLAGFEKNWNPESYKGVGNVPFNTEGKGTQIRNLTSLISRSSYEDNVWLQSGQRFRSLEGFLGEQYGTIADTSESDLQKFVGIRREIPQFLSTSIDRGGGSYVPGDVILNIYCPAGSNMLYVQEDGRYGKGEHEMILQRGATYEITKIYYGYDDIGQKKLFVDMELHSELGYNLYEA